MLPGWRDRARNDPSSRQGRSLTQLLDHELAVRAGRDDVDAFTELVGRHERRVRSFLARLAGPVLADDLAQDTFLAAWRKAGSYRGEGDYGAWLLRIAWRTFLSDRRVARDMHSEDHETVEQSVPAAQGTALDIDRSLARLSPTERAAALLCYAEGWSHAEAADILGMPLGTLKSTVARARARLAASLGGYEP